MSRTHPIATGGLFSTPKVSFSQETQELLKVMMEESRLTNFQQRQLKQKMRGGESLPLQCHPTSSSKPVRRSQQKSCSVSNNRRGLRTRDTITQLQAASEDDTPPIIVPRYNSSHEKERLQKIMSCDSDDMSKIQEKKITVQEEDEIDRFDEVVEEIVERQEFLRDMEELGQDKNYKSKILTEISQRLRELELLDKERFASLNNY